MTTSKEELCDGELLRPAGHDLDAGVVRGQDGPHSLVGLDGRDVRDPLRQKPREDAGSGSDLEDVGGALREQPVERRRRGPERSRLYSSATAPNERLRMVVVSSWRTTQNLARHRIERTGAAGPGCLRAGASRPVATATPDPGRPTR